MRRLVASVFVTLDGVTQAPGGPDEDPAGFDYGGRTAPYWDAVADEANEEGLSRPFDLLLGRRTYDVFAGFWPHVDADPASSTFAAPQAQVANTFFAVALGTGKRLFGEGTRPAAFRLTRSAASPRGVRIATFERAGAVRTGTLALDTATEPAPPAAA